MSHSSLNIALKTALAPNRTGANVIGNTDDKRLSKKLLTAVKIIGGIQTVDLLNMTNAGTPLIKHI